MPIADVFLMFHEITLVNIVLIRQPDENNSLIWFWKNKLITSVIHTYIYSDE